MFAVVLITVFAFQTQALPNVFQYEIQKAEEYVKTLEISRQPEGGYRDIPDAETAQQRTDVWSVGNRKLTTRWKDCGNASSMISIKGLSVTPDPLHFPGPLTIQTKFNVKKAVTDPLTAKLVIQKKVGSAYIEIPCIEDFGSCTYDNLCERLESIQAQCPDPVKKIGLQCKCPIPQGSFSLPMASFNIEVSLIPTGTYHAVAQVTHSGAEVACLDLYLSIV